MNEISSKAIQYAVKQLLSIADPTGSLNYTLKLISKELSEMRINGSSKTIHFTLVSGDQWEQVRLRIKEILWYNDRTVSNKQLSETGLLQENIPALFYENIPRHFVEVVSEDHIIIHADIISTTLFMLTRWEEMQEHNKDKHGRFLAKESAAYHYHLLHRPIVDEYGMLLRMAMQYLLPQWKAEKREFNVILSHDIDQTQRFSGFLPTLRTIIGGDLIRQHSIKSAAKSTIQYIKKLNGKAYDPYLQGIIDLAELSQKHGLKSEFYFKTASKKTYDSGNPLNDNVKMIVRQLKDMNLSVGFHPGYHTYDNATLFMEEKERMDQTFGITEYGGRQHYLRFKVPDTWLLWEKACLKYDSTMGFADHEGFRCGTCHPFRPFDLRQDREIDLLEIPLIVMDTSLRQYRGLKVDEAYMITMELANICRQYEGIFTILWHNQSLERDWSDWFEMYKKVVGLLSKS